MGRAPGRRRTVPPSGRVVVHFLLLTPAAVFWLFAVEAALGASRRGADGATLLELWGVYVLPFALLFVASTVLAVRRERLGTSARVLAYGALTLGAAPLVAFLVFAAPSILDDHSMAHVLRVYSGIAAFALLSPALHVAALVRGPRPSPGAARS